MSLTSIEKVYRRHICFFPTFNTLHAYYSIEAIPQAECLYFFSFVFVVEQAKIGSLYFVQSQIRGRFFLKFAFKSTFCV